MADSTDIFLKILEQSWTQARQSEDQRAFLTNLIVLISAAIYGVLTQTGFAKRALPLTIALIVLGLYGAIASEKFYERYRHHIYRAGAIRKRLEELYPDSQIEKLMDNADREHSSKYPILARKIHLHSLWLVLHLLIAASGLIYTLIILFQ